MLSHMPNMPIYLTSFWCGSNVRSRDTHSFATRVRIASTTSFPAAAFEYHQLDPVLRSFGDFAVPRKQCVAMAGTVGYDDVDLAATDIVQELLQGGAVEGSTGQTAVIIVGADQPPAFVGLAFDVGLAGPRAGLLWVIRERRSAVTRRGHIRLAS
jgi:hypothetical protein